MAEHDPGEFTVECDNCGETLEFGTSEYAGDPPSWGIDDDTLAEQGWKRESGQIFCKDCLESLEEQENED